MAVLGAFALLPGGAARPDTVSAAYDCDEDSHTLTLRFLNEDDDVVSNIEGFEITISPHPYDESGSGSLLVEDGDTTGTNQDHDGAANGVIVLEEVCETTEDSTYVVTATVPDDCEFIGDDATFSNEAALVDAAEDELEFELTANRTGSFYVECEGAGVTPTVGAAATVVAQASPSTVNCNGTSIVTIQVKTAGGAPVAVGTAVTIQASIGSVSPSSGQTTSADGSVFVFYTAPSNAGGPATITARAGNAQGTATVTVNCAAAAPTATTAPSAPPPTVNPGSISPPNTGDAGIAGDRTDWTPFAGIAVIVATLIGGAVAAVKTRE